MILLGLFTLFADRALDLHSWFIASLHMNARNGAWWLAVGRRANGFQCGVKERLQDGAGCLDSDLGLSRPGVRGEWQRAPSTNREPQQFLFAEKKADSNTSN